MTKTRQRQINVHDRCATLEQVCHYLEKREATRLTPNPKTQPPQILIYVLDDEARSLHQHSRYLLGTNFSITNDNARFCPSPSGDLGVWYKGRTDFFALGAESLKLFHLGFSDSPKEKFGYVNRGACYTMNPEQALVAFPTE